MAPSSPRLNESESLSGGSAICISKFSEHANAQQWLRTTTLVATDSPGILERLNLTETKLKVFGHHFASKLPVELIGGFQDCPTASDSSDLAWTWKSTLKSVLRPLVLAQVVFGPSRTQKLEASVAQLRIEQVPQAALE